MLRRIMLGLNMTLLELSLFHKGLMEESVGGRKSQVWGGLFGAKKSQLRSEKREGWGSEGPGGLLPIKVFGRIPS